MGELRSGGEWRPKVRLIAHDDSGKAGGGDAHHREVGTVQREGLSQYQRVRAQMLLPESMAEHDHWMRRGYPVFLRQERATHHGLDPEDGEEVARDKLALDQSAGCRSAPAHGSHFPVEGEQARKDLVVVGLINGARVGFRNLLSY